MVLVESQEVGRVLFVSVRMLFSRSEKKDLPRHLTFFIRPGQGFLLLDQQYVHLPPVDHLPLPVPYGDSHSRLHQFAEPPLHFSSRKRVSDRTFLIHSIWTQQCEAKLRPLFSRKSLGQSDFTTLGFDYSAYVFFTPGIRQSLCLSYFCRNFRKWCIGIHSY